MGAKNLIRKTVGWCWNHLYIYNSFLMSNIRAADGAAIGWQAGYSTNPSYYPVLNRVMSGWFNTRETMLALCARMQTSASLTGNQHLWPQGGMRWKFDVTNVTNARTRFKLYWCSLKCNDRGQEKAVFLANYATPFTSGTANPGTTGASDYKNDVYSRYWSFFDQSTRQPQTGDPPLIVSRVDRAHATNIVSSEGVGAPAGNQYIAPLPSAYSEVVYGPGVTNLWEIIPNVNSDFVDADILYNERLTFTFPRMARKLNIKLVAQKSVGPYGTASFRCTTKMPSELRPEQLRSDNCDNFFAGVSGFWYVKAISDPITVKVPSATYGDAYSGQSDYTTYVGAKAQSFEMWSRCPVGLRFRVYQELAVRSAFDAQPTFLTMFGGVPTAQYPAASADYLVSNQGFYNDGDEITNQQAATLVRAPAGRLYMGPTGPKTFPTATPTVVQLMA